MATRTIPVNSGLVTSRDKSTLQPGELSRAVDAEYLPNDTVGIHKVSGRTAYNSTPEGSPIKGVSYMEFENDADQIAIHAGESYQFGDAELTGSFAVPTSRTGADMAVRLEGGDTMDAAHYNNKYYVFNGVDKNREVLTGENSEIEAFGTAAFRTPTSGVIVGQQALTMPGTLTLEVLDNSLGSFNDGDEFHAWVVERDLATGKFSPASTASVVVGSGVTNAQIRITWSAPANEWVEDAYTSETANLMLSLFGSNSDSEEFPVGSEINVQSTGIDGINYYGARMVGSAWNVSTVTIDSYTDLRTVTSGSTGLMTFPIETVTIYGISQTVERYGAAPISTTGDVFEDSVVVNDVANKSLIQYSFPDEPAAYPSFNFINFETRQADEVTLIRTINNSLIVCLANSTWRVNYLPRPQDHEFDRGRAKDKVIGKFGCVGPLAADTFGFGTRERLAFVSKSGIIVTDGSTWDVLTDDLDWEAFSAQDLTASVLINNPRKWRLEWDFGGETYFFCYHPNHAKGDQGNPRAKTTGPITRAAKDATVAVISNIYHVLTANADGKVYVEENGDDHDDGSVISFDVETGDLYEAGVGNHFNVDEMWVHHSQGAVGQEAKATITSVNSDEDDVLSSATITLDRREPETTDLRANGEAVRCRVRNSDTLGAFRVNYFALAGDDLGESEEG